MNRQVRGRNCFEQVEQPRRDRLTQRQRLDLLFKRWSETVARVNQRMLVIGGSQHEAMTSFSGRQLNDSSCHLLCFQIKCERIRICSPVHQWQRSDALLKKYCEDEHTNRQ